MENVEQVSTQICWQDVILGVSTSTGLYSSQSQEHGKRWSQCEQTVQLAHDKTPQYIYISDQLTETGNYSTQSVNFTTAAQTCFLMLCWWHGG